jgi:hypothetical protein
MKNTAYFQELFQPGQFNLLKKQVFHAPESRYF